MANYFKLEEKDIFGIKIIDDQHQYFVSILDKIYQAILNSMSRSDQDQLLEELIQYATMHFTTEEKYFDEFNYEGALEHKEEHRKLKEKVLKFQADFKAGQSELSVTILDFLEDWLVDHLSMMDRKYVTCFQEHGLN